MMGDCLKLDDVCFIPNNFQLIILLCYYPMPYSIATERVMNIDHIVSQIIKSVFMT
jgi:hypothetical protein